MSIVRRAVSGARAPERSYGHVAPAYRHSLNGVGCDRQGAACWTENGQQGSAPSWQGTATESARRRLGRRRGSRAPVRPPAAHASDAAAAGGVAGQGHAGRGGGASRKHRVHPRAHAVRPLPGADGGLRGRLHASGRTGVVSLQGGGELVPPPPLRHELEYPLVRWQLGWVDPRGAVLGGLGLCVCNRRRADSQAERRAVNSPSS
jgi:hypothetical protein